MATLPRAPQFNPRQDVVEGFVYDSHVGTNVTSHPRRAAIVAVKATNVVLKCYCGRMYRVKKKDNPANTLALKKAGIFYSIHMYEGAGHAFFNDTGTRYNKAAADLAWQRTLAFFNAKLKA